MISDVFEHNIQDTEFDKDRVIIKYYIYIYILNEAKCTFCLYFRNL